MLLTYNPFAELAEYIPAFVQQGYVIAMAIAVVVGTALEVISKGSAKYFAEKFQKSSTKNGRKISGGEMAAIGVKVALNEVATSSEFANPKRRMSHLMIMWGFIAFLVASVAMVFGYADPAAATSTPGIWPALWHLGALSLAFGGYWFWFFIRVDVFAEGHPWYKIEREDLFILSLLGTATFGLLWSVLQYGGVAVWQYVALGLFVIASTVLFGTVLWSKFAHMFFKPAAAFEKHVAKKMHGAHDNLPMLTRDDPKQRERHSMELLKDAPMDMGLGIKREPANHY